MTVPCTAGFNRKKGFRIIKKTRQTLDYQIHTNLKDKIHFGESKHVDKQVLKFGESTYKIYSYSTYNTYLKECIKFSKWLVEEKELLKKTDLKETEKYINEYLQSRIDNDFSMYTVKLQKSALAMLFCKTIDYPLPRRNNKNIKRSRNETVNDKHYSRTGKYADIFTIALATGCRRCDLKCLQADCLLEIEGYLYIKIRQSKGGRDRLSFVREEYVKEVKEIVLKRQEQGHNKVFDKIPPKIDIHDLRREYCKNLYKDIKNNKSLRDSILKNYPLRAEYKYNKSKDGIPHRKQIKRNYYRDRNGNIYDRDDIYALSQNLGHNRLDVTITHYLK